MKQQGGILLNTDIWKKNRNGKMATLPKKPTYHSRIYFNLKAGTGLYASSGQMSHTVCSDV